MNTKKLACFFLLTLYLSNQSVAQKINPDGSVTINKNDEKIVLTAYANNIIKVTITPKSYTRNEQISDAVMLKPLRGKASVTSSGNAQNIEWKNLSVTVKEDSFFFGRKKNAVFCKTFDSGTYRGFKFLLSASEKIFGAGERALPLNRRGYKFNLYNQPAYGYGVGQADLNYSVPFITSSEGYALFFDNVSKGYLDIGKTEKNILEYGASSGELNFYFIQGDSYGELLTSYHKLTGRQPLPPRWAMGNFLSRFGYMSQSEVLSITGKMKAAQIPYDAVILDLFWFGDSIKGTLGNLDWVNKQAWPQPQQMIGSLKKEGTQTILITEPFVVKTSSNYQSSKKYHAVDSAGKPYVIDGFYFGAAGLIDIFRKDSKDWFWSKYKMQMNKGVEGWWGDLGEPETHPSNVYHNLKDLGFNRLFKADEVHNIYGHYWTKMLFDKYAKEYPDKRLFSLNRSGFAGTQRYSIFPWTGDVARSWSGLQAQLPVLLGMSMSGIPYVHSDAGGFAGGDKDAELYVRWLQFAQFTPLFKPHGTELSLIDTTVSNFPSEPALFNEPYRSMAKRSVEERYALMPYNYTLAYEQATTGAPLISPLYYYFSKDSNSYKIEDEFLWGKNILVAPILKKSATSRQVYLPLGNWFDYNTHELLKGGSNFTAEAKLETIPVYVKAGSFVPKLKDRIANTSSYSTKNLDVLYFPGRNATEFKLFDDDGNTNKAIEKKLYELISFQSNGWNGATRFSITSNGGNFKGKPSVRDIHLTIPGVLQKPTLVQINGEKLGDYANKQKNYFEWNQVKLTLVIHFQFTGQPMQIDVKN